MTNMRTQVEILRLINGIEVVTEVQANSRNCKHPLQILEIVGDQIKFSPLAPYCKTAFVQINFDLVLLHHSANDQMTKLWHEASTRLTMAEKGIIPAKAGDLARIKTPP